MKFELFCHTLGGRSYWGIDLWSSCDVWFQIRIRLHRLSCGFTIRPRRNT
jgi:hypothetical protein